ncbi:T9SS type A sorting domain-containing protein [Adhaeribacter sp. BT258]|uniref:T9SS type A sorting domain-containing protein n=1 Tax=Adhaeribacter terrigena TaxID=2793070 RepID=A0ABS1BZP1_9BACT|nr:T9SS type A sorting domain-containing protein [Adhaeribacter terrigena]MBK0402382.1 T9SS type A sorting domain-containing protein [Adhaeribacter terrigena]
MRKTIPFALLFFLFQVRVFAQLSLPFFDDFARYNNRLDATKWLPQSSVYVNDRFSNNPVSKNIVTFNGFLADGKINASSSQSIVEVDTLTSRPINLSNRSAADSVYLSFFLQTGGIGNNPGSNASFKVEFKTNTGVWEQAFQRSGTPTQAALPNFTPFFVRISDPKFFHANFQFRFRSTGRTSLVRDTWNLDYVLLNSGRQKNNALMVDDVALIQPLNSILKRYSAMPAHQFIGHVATELNDSLYTVLKNLSGQPRADSLLALVQVGNNAPVRFDNSIVAINPFPATYLYSATPTAAPFSSVSGAVNIKSIIVVENNEASLATQYNDTITRITPLQNYYAYDDGSAESVVSVQQGVTGQIAHKFTVNKADMVEALTFYLPKVQNQKGTFVNFRIWDEVNGNPAPSPRFNYGFSVPDISRLDTFITIPVNPPVSVSSSFYVGWSSSNQYFFSVGLDRNESSRGNARFLIAGNSWQNYSNIDGAIMLRPVMNNNIVGISENQQAKPNVQVYPNPATAVVNIKGNFDAVRLLTLTGQLVLEKAGMAAETQLQTSHLKPGMYLLQVVNKNRIQTHKLIIQPN